MKKFRIAIIIFSVLMLFGCSKKIGRNMGESKQYENIEKLETKTGDIISESNIKFSKEFDGKIESLDIKGRAVSIFIKCTKNKNIKVYSNVEEKAINIEVEGETLRISNDYEYVRKNKKEVIIVVEIPKGNLKDIVSTFEASKLNIENLKVEAALVQMTAGDLNMSNFSSNEVKLNLKAGDFNLENSDLKNTTLEVDATDVKVENAKIKDLSLHGHSSPIYINSTNIESGKIDGSAVDLEISGSYLKDVYLKFENDSDVIIENSTFENGSIDVEEENLTKEDVKFIGDVKIKD